MKRKVTGEYTVRFKEPMPAIAQLGEPTID
jgi:hypothetical protein